MRTRRTLALCAAGAAAAVLAGEAGGGTAVASRMVLRLSDLPAGFYVSRSETGPFTNADVRAYYGPAYAARLARLGRITGYRATYGQRDPQYGALPGILFFGTTVTVYKTSRGAHRARALRGFGCLNKGFSFVPLGRRRPVGPDTRICTKPQLENGAPARYFLVQWRNGRATGGLFVIAARGTATPWTALVGARKQNRRMTAELRRA